uniref:Uncharacterized protein n=1 Tax=Candidatus Kentrum sp. FW TaxID=2126338 RepID=A0A450RUJ6_9GAMM|nr:MAG: hypothetical protein BECKFW1821A_GA0114235_100281 [Candidatus Kentron sp. FW]
MSPVLQSTHCFTDACSHFAGLRRSSASQSLSVSMQNAALHFSFPDYFVYFPLGFTNKSNFNGSLLMQGYGSLV